jgi:hypothetical protein
MLDMCIVRTQDRRQAQHDAERKAEQAAGDGWEGTDNWGDGWEVDGGGDEGGGVVSAAAGTNAKKVVATARAQLECGGERDGWEGGEDGVDERGEGGSASVEAAAGMDGGLTAAGSAKRLGLESDSDSVYESASDGDDEVPFWERVDVSEWGARGVDVEASGVERVLPTMALLHAPHAAMRVPLTQAPPFMTEDMLRDREAALQALSRSTAAPATAMTTSTEHDMLLSDMCAFKAANPGACWADFVRWHSPRDWVDAAADRCGGGGGGGRTGEAAGVPPIGRLSDRMTAHRNMWGQLWQRSRPQAAADQKPLLDPEAEGEKVRVPLPSTISFSGERASVSAAPLTNAAWVLQVLHWLDTVPPGELFVQLVGIAYSAVAGLLTAARCADVPAVRQDLAAMHETATTIVTRPCPFPEEYDALCDAVTVRARTRPHTGCLPLCSLCPLLPFRRGRAFTEVDCGAAVRCL